MTDPEHFSVFLDLMPNLPRNDHSREQLRAALRGRFDNRVSEMAERIWDLPPMVVRPEGEYLPLLIEARELYVSGYFYSCVAMCGIVGERLIKDVLRVSVYIKSNAAVTLPDVAAFDQLERVDVAALNRFLHLAGLLSVEATGAAEKLGQFRNQYAHARGKDPKNDAIRAIMLLHTIVEDSVSILKHYEVREGVFTPRPGR